MYTRRLNTAFALLLSAMVLAGTWGCASTPKFQGMTSDELFALGAQEFAREEWGEATEAFERLIYNDPTYERMVESRMYLARAYFNKKDYITAVAEFSRIMDRYPDHAMVPQASLGICQAYAAQSPHVQRDQIYTIQAWNACENTVTDFAGNEVAVQGRAIRDEMEAKLAEKIYIAGDFYYRRKLYHPGIIYFNDLLTQYPRSEWAAEALFRLYQSYTALDWGREAGEMGDRLLRSFPDSDAAQRYRAEVEAANGTPPDTAGAVGPILPSPGF